MKFTAIPKIEMEKQNLQQRDLLLRQLLLENQLLLQNEQRIEDKVFNADYFYQTQPLFHQNQPQYYSLPCYEDQINLAILAVTAAGIPIMWYILREKILASGGRRRKRSLDFVDILSYFLTSKSLKMISNERRRVLNPAEQMKRSNFELKIDQK